MVSGYLSGALNATHRPEASSSASASSIYIVSKGSPSPTPSDADITDDFSILTIQGSLPDQASWSIGKLTDLRYGENPHQIAALYLTSGMDGLANGEILSGKEMSFNNYIDADAAWQLVTDFDATACAIIKHTNPAGVGLGATVSEAYEKALATDPVSDSAASLLSIGRSMQQPHKR